MKDLPSSEREFVRDELAWLADRLMKRCKLTIPEARAAIREILDCAV